MRHNAASSNPKPIRQNNQSLSSVEIDELRSKANRLEAIRQYQLMKKNETERILDDKKRKEYERKDGLLRGKR